MATIFGQDKVHRILTVICQIPHGHVATYGQIAKLAGLPRNARQVGAVLKTLPQGSGVPWFRVVNSKGEISDRKNQISELTQRQALEEEQVTFSKSGKISLTQFGWEP